MLSPEEPIGEYQPRVALVTGAAQGIGRSIALRLAQDGYDVAINDYGLQQFPKLDSLADEIKALGREVAVVVADVSLEDDVEQMVKQTVDELGSLDIVIANAGIVSTADVLDLDADEYDRVMNVNARGVFLTYKYGAQQMVDQHRGGRIIGASSTLGKSARGGCSVYCMTQFAIRGLTQSFAHEMAPFNVTVNAYAPGVIITPMTTAETDSALDGPGSTLKQFLGSPDAPSAEPEVIASLVTYLVKPEAHFITGQSISVSGGAFHMD